MEELTIWEQHTITLNKVSSVDSVCSVCVSSLHGEFFVLDCRST